MEVKGLGKVLCVNEVHVVVVVEMLRLNLVPVELGKVDVRFSDVLVVDGMMTGNETVPVTGRTLRGEVVLFLYGYVLDVVLGSVEITPGVSVEIRTTVVVLFICDTIG